MKSIEDTRRDEKPIHRFISARLRFRSESIFNRSSQIFPTVQRYFAIGNLKSQHLNLRANIYTHTTRQCKAVILSRRQKAEIKFPPDMHVRIRPILEGLLAPCSLAPVDNLVPAHLAGEEFCINFTRKIERYLCSSNGEETSIDGGRRRTFVNGTWRGNSR